MSGPVQRTTHDQGASIHVGSFAAEVRVSPWVSVRSTHAIGRRACGVKRDGRWRCRNWEADRSKVREPVLRSS
jgi:hypothetical protein